MSGLITRFKMFIRINGNLWWLKMRFLKQSKEISKLKKKCSYYKTKTLAQQLPEIKKKKKSDTLVIFGNGSSLAGYTKSEWDEVSQFDTLVVNDGIIIPVVPTYFFLEAGCKDSLINNIHLRADDLKETAILYRMDEIFKYYYKHSPRQLKENVVGYACVVPGYKSLHDLSYFYTKVAKTRIDQSALEKGIIIDSFGSIVRAMIFGISLGYKEIILCGVDLKSGQYFFDVLKKDLESKGFMIPVNSISNQSKVHNTVDKSRRSITADDVMYAVHDYLARPLGVDIFVYRDSSLLYPRIPLYKAIK
jgi:hypothetical protein